MPPKEPVGLFFTGTDTGVGKTYVAALVARALAAEGHRVGVYKPVASGCRLEGGQLVSDAVALWEAAGRPGELDRVCPQRFAAPIAPNLAAKVAGLRVDFELLREGAEYWRERSDIVLVEGAGGLVSPMDDEKYVADLANVLGYPLVIVARNALGVINQTMQTIIAAKTLCQAIRVSCVVLSRPTPPDDDASLPSNRDELAHCLTGPLLTNIVWGSGRTDPPIDWFGLASAIG